MLEKVSKVTPRTASKNHVCSFSGQKIVKGEMYYEFVYKTVEGVHHTYRVKLEELDTFIHDNCYMVVEDITTANMRKDVKSVHNTLRVFWDKYKDMAGIREKLARFKDLLTLPL